MAKSQLRDRAVPPRALSAVCGPGDQRGTPRDALLRRPRFTGIALPRAVAASRAVVVPRAVALRRRVASSRAVALCGGRSPCPAQSRYPA